MKKKERLSTLPFSHLSIRPDCAQVITPLVMSLCYSVIKRRSGVRSAPYGRVKPPMRETMRKKRFRLIAGLAATTLCLFAMSGYAQNTNTPGTTGAAGTGGGAATAAPQTTTTGTEVTRSTGTTTTTTTTTFPGGVLGILAVAVIILLVLFALFRGRDRTVIRETSTSSSAAPPRTGTATSDAASARAASGTGTSSSSSTNDPNARR
jgi:hypothetical protein